MMEDVEVRCDVLQDRCVEVEFLDDDIEIIYSDVNLESIAEVLTEVSVEDLKQQLGYYGTWMIVKFEGTYILYE